MARIYLSPPDVGPSDLDAVQRAFASGWIAPLGPEVDAFEKELAHATGRSHGVALSSGTAALHLALILNNVSAGDRVLVSTLTFSATVNAIRYVGGEPVFVDSDLESWNMDPGLLEKALTEGEYSACIPVDIYGQCAAYRDIEELCSDAGVPLIEDAAEALGARYDGRAGGSFGNMAALSFNGNKIITTSGGGALVCDDEDTAEKARWLATQARDPAPHYQHSSVGYNYRLSNLLAAIGRSQLADLGRRVEARRSINRRYRDAFSGLPGMSFMDASPMSEPTHWLTVILIDPDASPVTREDLRLHLESADIEARPVWKPMHLQPVFEHHDAYGGAVSEMLFHNGLCLPSGSAMGDADFDRVVNTVFERFDSA